MQVLRSTDVQQEARLFPFRLNKCKKSNHFASVCNSTRRDHVNNVEDENDSDSDLSVLTVDVVSAIAGKGKQVLAKLTFCIQDKFKTSMECQLDTGVSCNVISYRDFSIPLQNGSPPLNQSSVKLRLFDGCIMRTLRETRLTAEYVGKCHTLKFQVVNCTNKPLQYAEACERMGLLKFVFTPSESVNMVENMADHPLSKEKILSSYKDVFDGLGHIGNSSLVTDDTRCNQFKTHPDVSQSRFAMN